jgi:polyisoprenoid-binding protein YceI
MLKMSRFAAILMLAASALVGLAAQTAPVSAPASSGAVAFDFKDPKGVNALAITLDSELEPMIGTGSDLSGTLTIDPANPAAATGSLRLAAASVKMTNDKMTSVLHSADWLDIEKHPSIDVVIKKVSAAKNAKADIFDLTCDAQVTIKGVSKNIPLSVQATYLPGRGGDRMRGSDGDLLVLRSSFIVKRSDFGIKPDAPATVVADEIRISGSIVGLAAKK